MRRFDSSIAGFTLLELLVVMAIVGLLVTFTGLTIGPEDNSELSLHDNASSLINQMAIAEASAVLSGQPVGMHLLPPTTDQENWQLKWSRWQNAQWRESSNRLPELSLPVDLPIELTVDGQVLDLYRQNQIQRQAPELIDNVLARPSLVFFPTGEASQFTLRLGLDEVDSLKIGNTNSGTIEISESE